MSHSFTAEELSSPTHLRFHEPTSLLAARLDYIDTSLFKFVETYKVNQTFIETLLYSPKTSTVRNKLVLTKRILSGLWPDHKDVGKDTYERLALYVLLQKHRRYHRIKPSAFACFLYEQRAIENLTIVDMAQRMGIPGERYGKLEEGQEKFKNELCDKFEYAFDRKIPGEYI